MLGGDALNQAVVLSKLGAKTGLMGVVGSDKLGDILLSQLSNYNLSVFDRKIEKKTAISIVLIGDNHERHFLYQPGHNDYLSFEHLDTDVIRQATIVSVGGAMALRSLDGEGMVRLLELAHSSGAITVMDFRINRDDYDMNSVQRMIELTDYLLPSEAEASWLTGENNPKKMAEGLHKFGAKNCVIKLGGSGCFVSADGIEKMINSYPCKCIDTTGAGDTFTGAFLYGKSQGWDIETCVCFGNAAGSIAVEHPGANTAIHNLQQVLERMKNGK